MSVKKLCVTAMGIALFVVLALCLQVPVFENYYLCFGYTAMMIFCWYFGPVSGMIVGSLGVVLYCLLINGLRGMPGWSAGNIVIGLTVGLTCKYTLRINRPWLRSAIIMLSIVLSAAIGILGIKSFIEFVLYSEPLFIRIAKNIYAFIADSVIMIISIPICIGVNSIMHKLYKTEITA